MAQKASTNGSGLRKPPMAKDEIISLVIRDLGLQPDCSILDLDNLSVLSQPLSQAQLAVWLDSWSDLVAALGTYDDASVGVHKARAMLGEVSDHADYLLFSADSTKPPLDQFSKGIKMLFEASTGLEAKEIATYKGRKVYLGSKRGSPAQAS
jgi:hypothetical protein